MEVSKYKEIIDKYMVHPSDVDVNLFNMLIQVNILEELQKLNKKKEAKL
jgi:hypothetical protein